MASTARSRPLTLALVTLLVTAVVTDARAGDLDALLRAVVDSEGVVHESELLERSSDLRLVLRSFGGFEPRVVGREERVAFWLNAYTAVLLAALGDGERTDDVEGRARFFHWFPEWIAGRPRSLDEIREALSTDAARDPRIHLAIPGIARSEPRLRRSRFRAETLPADLERAALDFVADPTNARVDRASREIVVSPLFRLYEEDFTRAAGSVAAFVRRRLPGAVRKETREFRIRYSPFDWRIRTRRPSTTKRSSANSRIASG